MPENLRKKCATGVGVPPVAAWDGHETQIGARSGPTSAGSAAELK
jgi:hypothetical protein